MTKLTLQKQHGQWKVTSKMPDNWDFRDNHKDWTEDRCDECSIFVQWYHHPKNGDCDYYDKDGKLMNSNIHAFSTDSFADELDIKRMPKNYNWLCESCFNHWRKNGTEDDEITSDVVGFTWHANIYCVKCGSKLSKIDPEGNPKHEVIFGEEWDNQPSCAECGEEIEGLSILSEEDEN